MRVLLVLLATYFVLAQSVNVVVILHMHQPWYLDLEKGELSLPWVRMHAVGNYLKVPLLINETGFPVAYTLSGSLIEQLNWYSNGTYTDARFKISEKLARGELLTDEEKYLMFSVPGGFFDVNWQNIVYRHPRYAVLLGARNDAFSRCPPGDVQCVVSRFTDQDFVDLATLFNLMWIDPHVARLENLWHLRNKTFYTREDLDAVLKTHLKIVKGVLPLYRKLNLQGRAELVAVPYSHPLMPLLSDMGATDDLKIHIDLTNRLFARYLSSTPRGVWPPEMAVNDEVLRLFVDSGYLWTVTDEDVLKLSGGDNHYMLYYFEHQGKRLYVFFRDKTVSDNLGFRYASMSPRDALVDFVNYIKKVPRDECSVLVIALDGENPWESYPNFGVDFIRDFFKGLVDLEKEGLIKLWTPSKFVEECAAKARPLQIRQYRYFDLTVDMSFYKSIRELPTRHVAGRIAEGSWSGGGSLAVWIGDVDENVWWMWLRKAREDVGPVDKWEVLFPLLVAEASDWPFWYGGEWGSPKTFDPIAKAALRAFYRKAGLEPPSYLYAISYPGGTPPDLVGRGSVRVEMLNGAVVEANLTHLKAEGPCGIFYFSNPDIPRSPYVPRGAVFGLKGEKLSIYADMAIDSCRGVVYVADRGMYVPVGNEARLSFIRATPGGRLYVEHRGLTYLLEIPEESRVQRLLVAADDPAGDDNGPGTYQYPKNPVFRPGVFDLLKFEMYDLGEFLRFVFTVKELGGNPWGGPAGFSLQFFHVYIDRGRGVRNDTLGLRVALCRDASWDVALLIGPGWTGGNKIVFPQFEVDDVMTVRVGANNTIIADVPKRYVGEFSRDWKITVFLTSWDGYGPDNIRNFGVVADEWTVGGADPAAVLAKVAPRVFDLLSPSAKEQAAALKTYQVSRLPNGTYVGRLSEICAYIGEVKEAPQLPATVTMTYTVTRTVEKISNVTLTVEKTVVVREIDLVTTAVVAAVALVLAFVAYVVRLRRK